MFERMDSENASAAPSFDVTDEAKDQFKNLDCEVGDEVTAKLTNTGPGQFEISSVEYEGGAEEGEEAPPAPADDAEEKALGYKRPQGKFETPDIAGLTD